MLNKVAKLLTTIYFTSIVFQGILKNYKNENFPYNTSHINPPIR